MKEDICKEVQTENGGYITIETELIRCKDCKYWNGAGKFCDCEMIALEEDYCSNAEPKETA